MYFRMRHQKRAMRSSVLRLHVLLARAQGMSSMSNPMS